MPKIIVLIERKICAHLEVLMPAMVDEWTGQTGEYPEISVELALEILEKLQEYLDADPKYKWEVALVQGLLESVRKSTVAQLFTPEEVGREWVAGLNLPKVVLDGDDVDWYSCLNEKYHWSLRKDVAKFRDLAYKKVYLFNYSESGKRYYMRRDTRTTLTQVLGSEPTMDLEEVERRLNEYFEEELKKWNGPM